MLAAFDRGHIDLRKAQVFGDILTDIPPEITDRVLTQVLPEAPDLNSSQLREKLTRRLLAQCPGYARRRRTAAMRQRALQVYPDPFGTATNCINGVPAETAAAIHERVAAIAHTLAGDPTPTTACGPMSRLTCWPAPRPKPPPPPARACCTCR